MKFALSSLLLAGLASFAAPLESPPVPELIDFTKDYGNFHGRDLQTGCTPSISVAVSGSGGCFALGQTITVTVTTCPTPFPEWIGIFADGTASFTASSNWLFCCGDQTCARPVEPSTYTLSFGYESAGSLAWPLSDSFAGGGGTYRIFFHTGFGSFATAAFKITPGYFCEGPYAGLNVTEVPCSAVPEGLTCDDSSDDEDGDSGADEDGDADGDEDEEPCVKITPGQGGIPPGQGGIPPGLQCKDKLPPGIAKKQTGN